MSTKQETTTSQEKMNTQMELYKAEIKKQILDLNTTLSNLLEISATLCKDENVDESYVQVETSNLSEDQLSYFEGMHDIPRLGEVLDKISEDLKSRDIVPPWVKENTKYVTDLSKAAVFDPKKFSMFPVAPEDRDDWEAYCIQEMQFWTVKELDFAKDKAAFSKLSPRMQQLYKDVLGFLAPGDGVISQSVFRFVAEATSYPQQAFLFMQLAIEAIHAEGYGRSVEAILPTDKDKQEVFEMIETLPCVKAKTDFIDRLIKSNATKGERYFAAACCEGVFFVTLFTLIFLFRDKGSMDTFIHLNLLISADETLHRDFYGRKAGEFGISQERAVEILEEATRIEIDHLKYILREPIESKEQDLIMGIDVDKFSDFAKMLGDQILGLAGLSSHFNVTIDLPHMKDVSLGKKANFYERKTIGYKRSNVKDAIASGYGMKESDEVVESGSHFADPDVLDF